MNLDWDDDNVTTEAKITMVCPESNCKGYMELYPENGEEEFRVDELLVVPIRCNKCGWGGSIHLTMQT